MRVWLALILLSPSLWSQGVPLFEFHSGFWINLHHFLFEQASAEALLPSASQAWTAAVDYYRGQVIQRDLLSDEGARIDQALSQMEAGGWRGDLAVPAELGSILQSAASIYRERWWPEHDRANRAWIAAVAPLLASHGIEMRSWLSTIYDTPWPSAPIRTDVSEYANWAGAYSTLGPAHIVVSSANPAYRGDAALEMLFHEASHALAPKLRTTLSTTARAKNKLFRRMDFWHAILFYTAGTLMQERIPGYVPYAVKRDLYTGPWEGVEIILDDHWKPYLEGRIDLSTAAQRLVEAYGVDQ